MRTVITIDIDWVPDKVLEYTLELLSKAGVPCTIFATHATGLLNGLDRNQFEIGIHPNFNPLLNGSKKKQRKSRGRCETIKRSISPGPGHSFPFIPGK